MKNYLVTISAYLPYERKFEYREQGCNFGTAIKRAYKKFRKEEQIKRKKLTEILVKAVRL